MKNKYDNIQQLISFWQEFEGANPTSDIAAFGQWLNIEKATYFLSQSSNNQSEKEQVSSESEINSPQRLMEIISRISRIQDFYAKKLFEGLPLNNLLEFNFLFSLNKNIFFKKKELIDSNLVEYTTGIDIIKRLIRLKLVNEFPDQIDKRSKRLKITSEGKRVLIDALLVVNKIGNLFFGNYPKEHWEYCKQNLSELEVYHKTLFIRGNTATGYEILKIIQEDK
jgi:MarR family transcriptional regulator, lower aerobic nicotinate degradation pathway regulator